jgi:plastocyanin
MLRVLGLASTTVLLLANLSCSGGGTNKQTTSGTPGTSSPTATASGTVAQSPTVAPTSPSPSAPPTANVKGTNFKWTDEASGTPVTTIKVGGSVTWTATGHHTLERVAPNATNGCQELDASFDSETMPVTRTFNKVGTFGYHCGIHGGTPKCNTPPGGPPGLMPGVIKVVP